MRASESHNDENEEEYKIFMRRIKNSLFAFPAFLFVSSFAVVIRIAACSEQCRTCPGEYDEK